VARYFDTFGRDRVEVILFDDFVRDPAASYRQLLRFLGVDETFETTFERVNESKRPRHRRFQDLVIRPPRPIARVIPLLRRFPAAHRLRLALLGMNSVQVARPPMSPELRRRLTAEFADEVRRLGELIGRDLSAWSRLDPAPLPVRSAPAEA
jgi:hypothetical protein